MYSEIMGRLLFVVALTASCASDEPTSEQRCAQVRDRLIDLRLANAKGVEVDGHRAAMKSALGDDFIQTCKTRLTVAQQQCVLRARDVAAATDCSAKH